MLVEKLLYKILTSNLLAATQNSKIQKNIITSIIGVIGGQSKIFTNAAE